MRRPAVKICGVTRVGDAELAVELGADLVGLNFYPPSPRAVEVSAAKRIADAVRGRTRVVGVFVDRPLGEVEQIGREVGLDLFQFHGDESADEIAPLAGRAIKALRVDESWSPRELEAWASVWGFLIESRHPSLYGGTGRSWGYGRLSSIDFDRPMLVAGGVGPDNARSALEESRAWGVDVCSGVESEPGVKDPDLLEALFAQLRTVDGSV